MDNKILVSDIAAQVNATDDDVRALDNQWQRMIRIDTDGSYYVESANQNYLWGALYSTAQNRREARVQAANARLIKAYTALKTSTAPASRSGQIAWQSKMIGLFTEVRDALVELCDAKVAAKMMKPSTAEALRVRANRVLRDAEGNASHAARQIRAISRSI
ncbi:hypothetical protein [Streptomyces violaceorubidus]|uniref:hypothetical protein n=1 Tax=Streptomyces violaceorubidus TaxID=284042 RepID=UPI0004BF64E1|nr:hypothetical protein [Streptomyces violaceorubidus]